MLFLLAASWFLNIRRLNYTIGTVNYMIIVMVTAAPRFFSDISSWISCCKELLHCKMHEWRELGDDASGSDAQRAARATRVKCMAEAVPGAESGAY